MRNRLLIYVEMFWLVFASVGFGMMFITMILTKTIPTRLDLYLFMALIGRVGLSIWWIDDIVKEEGRKCRKDKRTEEMEEKSK